MGKIIDVLRAKNPDIRIVINTIALESISEVLCILKEREIDATSFRSAHPDPAHWDATI